MKKFIPLILFISLNWAVDLTLTNRHRIRMKKFSSRNMSKKLDIFWYLILKGGDKNTYLRANVLLEPMGIIAEPLDGQPFEKIANFGDGAIKMTEIRETIDLSLAYYAKAELIKEGIFISNLNDPLILEKKAKIASDYDDPTTRVKYNGKTKIETPYHEHSLLLPYRFIRECQINVEPSDFLFPVKKLSQAEIDDLNLNKPQSKPSNLPGLNIPLLKTDTIPIDNEYQIKLIEMDEVDNTKCSWPIDKPLPFTEVLFFPSPASGQVVSTTPGSTQGMMDQCKRNIEFFKDSVLQYSSSLVSILEIYKMEIQILKLKSKLHQLFQNWLKYADEILQFFSSVGLNIPSMKVKIDLLTQFVNISADWSNLDISNYVKKFELEKTEKEFSKSLKLLEDPLEDFSCIPNDNSCVVKPYTEKDLEMEMSQI